MILSGKPYTLMISPYRKHFFGVPDYFKVSSKVLQFNLMPNGIYEEIVVFPLAMICWNSCNLPAGLSYVY